MPMILRKIILTIFLLVITSNAYALNLSRIKTWTASEILTAADLNGEFNNILNHSLTNNDIDAAAGIVGSKLNLSAPGIIGATTPAAGTYTNLTINGNTIIGDAAADTEHHNANIITYEGLTADDFETTIAITDPTADRTFTFPNVSGTLMLINSAQTVSVDHSFTGNPTFSTGIFTAPDINGGTLDNAQIGGTTATGELIVNDSLDDADGLGSQGTSGQVLQSQGAGVNPVFDDPDIELISVTSVSSTNSGDITIAASKLYKVIISLTNISADNTISLRISSNAGSNYYGFRQGISNPGIPATIDTAENTTTSFTLGTMDVDDANIKFFICEFLLDTNATSATTARWVGHVLDSTLAGQIEFVNFGGRIGGTIAVTDFEILSPSTMTGNVYVYEYDLSI